MVSPVASVALGILGAVAIPFAILGVVALRQRLAIELQVMKFRREMRRA